MPTSDATTTNNHASLKLFPGNSIYSSPDCSRDLGESHIWAAKHGCESFCVSAINAVFGTKNDGNGGGGIDTIELGGGPTSKHWIHIFSDWFQFTVQYKQFIYLLSILEIHLISLILFIYLDIAKTVHRLLLFAWDCCENNVGIYCNKPFIDFTFKWPVSM